MNRPVMRIVMAAVCGLLFGAGLAISGMIDPAKVIGFLDVTGAWDPSLGGVMAGAIPLAALLFAFGRRRGRSLSGDPLPASAVRTVDAGLAVGAVLFGVGWGMAGLCPGPGIADLVLDGRVVPFVASMAVGMGLVKLMGSFGLPR